MTRKQNFTLSAGETPDAEQLTQTIIDEMKAQGILDDFTDKDTGTTLLEIQFPGQTLVCNVNADETKKN